MSGGGSRAGAVVALAVGVLVVIGAYGLGRPSPVVQPRVTSPPPLPVPPSPRPASPAESGTAQETGTGRSRDGGV
jgi:hypothetical protein